VASGFVEATWEDCVVALKKDLYRALVLFPTGGRQIVTLLKNRHEEYLSDQPAYTRAPMLRAENCVLTRLVENGGLEGLASTGTRWLASR
jgi:hypothetical protein